MAMDYLEMKGIPVSRENYTLVYTGELKAGMSLEDIFTRVQHRPPGRLYRAFPFRQRCGGAASGRGEHKPLCGFRWLQGDTGVYKRTFHIGGNQRRKIPGHGGNSRILEEVAAEKCSGRAGQ